ncbi:hypothetical protein A4X09_0g5664 [Tilletia walkeri]|uniref:AC transposase n=1 Tax=Tilletia walkeri TaxID=117179 RepID=A0A8X7N524_9BASI|nr:hypothetical protein A4X09_0g5664 [Tilletia walkeri]
MMPSHQTVSRYIAKVSKAMVQHITNELAEVKGCFHLATDVWTSANGHAFLGLIICYQQSGVSVRRVLEMIPFLDQHTAVNVAEATHRVLMKYGVGSRNWNVVSDNASENTSMMPLLAAKNGLPRFKVDGDNDMSCRVRCAAHILNLISKSILNGFSPKKKKGQSSLTSDGNDDTGRNGVDIGDDDDSDSDSEASDEEGGDREVVVEDEDDLAVSRALNPDLDLTEDDDENQLDLISAQTSNAGKEGVTSNAAKRAACEVNMRNKEVADAIKKLAWLASLLRYSPRKRRIFERHCAKMGCEGPHRLLRDVVTRWDSTKDILQRGLDLWQGILSFTEAPHTPIPQEKRLKRSNEGDLRKLLDLLLPIAKATKQFSSTTPNIGDVIGMFKNLDKHFVNVSKTDGLEEVWKQAAARGHAMSAKYYGLTYQANVIAIGTLLHPNFRKYALGLLKWTKDWQNSAEAQPREVFHESYEMDEVEDEPQTESQRAAHDKLDELSKGLLQLAQSQREKTSPSEAIDLWLSEPITIYTRRSNGRAGRSAPMVVGRAREGE